jgi:DNA-binding NarL/FixJ family response regulator
VHRGEPALDASITRKMVKELVRARLPGAPSAVEALTERELEVLRLAARGLTNKAIAHSLNLSDRTVQGHLANVYGKLKVGSRTEAVTEGLRQGWIVIE